MTYCERTKFLSCFLWFHLSFEKKNLSGGLMNRHFDTLIEWQFNHHLQQIFLLPEALNKATPCYSCPVWPWFLIQNSCTYFFFFLSSKRIVWCELTEVQVVSETMGVIETIGNWCSHGYRPSREIYMSLINH